MINLSNTIYSYYLDNFDDLPFDKQFHFASRLHLWCQDPATRQLLDKLRGEFSANNQPQKALEDIIEAAKASPVHGSKNAAELRKPFFERYPMLKTYVSVLFRITFLRTIYNIDCRDLLFVFFKKEDLDKLKDQLLDDKEALAILSTHAINFLYLYERIITENDSSLPLQTFLLVGKEQYDLSNKLHMQLLIYLYTHCILGDSQFYYRIVPQQNSKIYKTMLDELEQLINNRFVEINLDNKFEYLVCCKLIGHPTSLAERIYDEAALSLSNQGSYLIDTHNQNPQTDNISLDKSEHRNVLFILAHRDFQPLG